MLDPPGPAIGKKPDEILPAVLGPGLGLVSVHTGIGPSGMLLDQAAVIADLR